MQAFQTTTARAVGLSLITALLGLATSQAVRAEGPTTFEPQTRVSLSGHRWFINDQLTYLGAPAEGLLMNVRMVNAVFEDTNPSTSPQGFDANANTDELLAYLDEYASHGVLALTISLQGGFPGYEGAINTAFDPQGNLRSDYRDRVARVIQACDERGMVVILSCFYQRQDEQLEDAKSLERAVEQTASWLKNEGYQNVVLEIANEFGHGGFDHQDLRSLEGQRRLIAVAKAAHAELLVGTSGLGGGDFPGELAEVCDFLLVHFNHTPLESFAEKVERLKQFGKPVVCNEDTKVGEAGAAAAKACVELGISWGLMLEKINQHAPFDFRGASDDPTVYAMLAHLTRADDYFPPSESAGGWRRLTDPEEIDRLAGMNPQRLAELEQWLLESDDRDFAAVVVSRGYIVLQVERGNSAVTDSRRLASVSKAVCATVLAIASHESQSGSLPHRMSFSDRAFDFIPWAQPLSDPRKADITVAQLFNHTSGLCPEAVGAPNDGRWEYVLGLSGDKRTESLAFDPGMGCGYSTHALCHAALVCETVTGMPYDQYAIRSLFQPIGCEHWWFQYYEGQEGIGRHPSHGMGMPARDLARIGYCMLRGGRWKERSVIPPWFVREAGAPTSTVSSPELRWNFNADYFSHAWELPARVNQENTQGQRPDGIPSDARFKPGSGGQLLAFVPSLDLVITRQTGSSGGWAFDEYLRRACAAVNASE